MEIKDTLTDENIINSKLIDARPALPVSEESLWSRAETERDNISLKLKEEFKKENMISWIRKSKPGEYPIHLLVESWKQVSETKITTTTDRSSLKITITVEPYLENPLSYHVELKHQNKQIKGTYWRLSDYQITELVSYLLNGGEKPSFFKPRARVTLIWRVLGVFIPFVGTPPKNKLLREVRPNYLTLDNLFTWGGVISSFVFIIAALSETDPEYIDVYILFAILGAFSFIGGLLIYHRRPRLAALPKQSIRSPREEYLIDSWQVSVPDAGQEFELFRSRIIKAVIENDPTVESELELHQNPTSRGFEERERLVLTKGQATLHLHIYPYAINAFVGWESYLNLYQWNEGKKVAETVDFDGNRISYHTLDAGFHIPTDFDLIDANVLAENVHRVLVNELKAFLKEKEIESDLDFQIIRGDRSKALNENKGEKKNKKSLSKRSK